MNKNDATKKELLGLFVKLSPRIDMLSEEQRILVRLFLSSHSYNSIAKTAGVNAATVARKLKRIAGRISSNNFITALSGNDSMPAEKMKIIRDYFVNGLGISAIARNTGLSDYKVKKIILRRERL